MYTYIVALVSAHIFNKDSIYPKKYAHITKLHIIMATVREWFCLMA